MWENCSQSITLRSFINFSRTPCFSPSLSSFIKLSNSKEKQWTLSNTWPALTATFSHGHMMKKHLSNKRISFLSIMSLSSSEMWLFFMQKELWQRARVFVCSSVCVGLTGHRLEVALQATPSLSNSQSVTAVLLYHFLRLCLPHTHFFCLLSQFFSLSLPHFCLWEPHSGTKDWTNRLSELMWINSYFLWLPVPFTTAEV